VRLVTPQLNWSGFIRLAFDEIRLAAAASPQVTRRLRATLEDLLSVAPPDRHEPLQRQLWLLEVDRGTIDSANSEPVILDFPGLTRLSGAGSARASLVHCEGGAAPAADGYRGRWLYPASS
jgi:hypothetical protein